ncbi:MAG: hypothetical protein ACI4QR_02675, partial [Eubacteriales bacterium]
MKKLLPMSLVIRKNRIRSGFSLFLSAAILVCAFVSVIIGALAVPTQITPERGGKIFMLFTVNSNLVAAVGAALMIPYSIDGLRRKWHSIPKWESRLLYCGAVSVCLTFLFSMSIILPKNGVSAVTGMNLGLHLICPILVMILFLCVENELSLTFLDSILALIPFACYSVVYAVMVLIIGEENGGWRDIYHLTQFLPSWAAIIVMYALAFAISSAIRAAHNYFSRVRAKHLSQDMLCIDKLPEYYDAYIAIAQLSKFFTGKSYTDEFIVPIDLLRQLSERYDGISLEEAINFYIQVSLERLKKSEKEGVKVEK